MIFGHFWHSLRFPGPGIETTWGQVLLHVGRLHVAPRQLLHHHPHRLHLAHPLPRHLEEYFQTNYAYSRCFILSLAIWRNIFKLNMHLVSVWLIFSPAIWRNIFKLNMHLVSVWLMLSPAIWRNIFKLIMHIVSILLMLSLSPSRGIFSNWTCNMQSR